ncbi:LysR family transcriptional regulator [Nocardioides halotolerans]|uniref:LysR family transcriptional regulator n=1 Tax=Nocardioides halotolerans TaxID=433660 RepID=UPI000415F430|nr:LysR substrate-binding domain-containing protein [Nocardioides halotolerans]
MELFELRAFLAVAEELHFGRAADRLLLAQPYLSRTIKKLEADLGVQLFDRTTRKVELTSAGSALIEPATEMLVLNTEARMEVRRAARGETGRVRISFAGPSSYDLIGRLGREMRELHPGIDLLFDPGRYGLQVSDRLLNGSIDLAIARFRTVPAGIEARPIAAERYLMAVPSTHPAADGGPVSLSSFRDDGFLGLPTDSAVQRDFLELCQIAGFVPTIAQTLPDTGTIMALVSAGAGVAFTVDTAIEHVPRQGISAVELSEKLDPVYAYLAWRRESSNAALHTVLRALETLFPTPPQPPDA